MQGRARSKNFGVQMLISTYKTFRFERTGFCSLAGKIWGASAPCEAPVPLPLIIISPPDLKTQRRLCIQEDGLVIQTNGSYLELAVALSAEFN